MKKIIFLLVVGLLITGCAMGNSPTSKVEELLMKYQKVDKDIASGIDSVIQDQGLTDEHKDRYRKLLEKQYKNLSYEIKDEKIDGDKATVTVEIEVLDYKKAINELSFDSEKDTKESYDEKKLKLLEEVHDKVKYTIDIELTRDSDGNWKVNALSNDEIKKIQGMY